MRSADTRITADVAEKFGLVTECFGNDNFNKVVIQRAVALALNPQVGGLLKFIA